MTAAPEFVTVFSGTIAGQPTLLVNARDLHAFLGVGKFFANWIKGRIDEYGFVVDQDFLIDLPNLANQNSGRGGDRRTKNYHVTLGTAKELAMVERTEKGRAIRRYFIECERLLMQHVPEVAPPASAPSNEPLTPAQYAELRQLVWQIGACFRQEKAARWAIYNVLRAHFCVRRVKSIQARQHPEVKGILNAMALMSSQFACWAKGAEKRFFREGLLQLLLASPKTAMTVGAMG